ncbi:Spo0E family sporulation regulatory protein-aspartic acid phosphatase [Clostridium estertheticum]|uniref:Spo0E family sporulation regulatory protein-aspartic acid phosphatase n=1 Tax=Clostridium estertheticum TaxID=238834 RepID=A0A5N7IQ89_9CLOT|nr:Spo0E family sporulation regulatory protein-aspartic acid phosphatase [Clostridium estertheticum]MBU3185632.1 Spo0E family sporulation regulatory protein-aspartic acid phosphatase [Clostridium estertheticum]MPQ32468.1 Spo0E family sporulation regulatory protein-aspartic acid phosphatase [Clostridium estertheticum]MPQ63127.1 Spo0E family sporulation regulatory protein-aspartic acid phosphatase [Clostridium estertheticum]
MKELKLKLDKLIIKNNFDLKAPEVIMVSQELDKVIAKEQKYRYALEDVLQNLRSIESPNSDDEYIDYSIKIIVEILK